MYRVWKVIFFLGWQSAKKLTDSGFWIFCRFRVLWIRIQILRIIKGAVPHWKCGFWFLIIYEKIGFQIVDSDSNCHPWCFLKDICFNILCRFSWQMSLYPINSLSVGYSLRIKILFVVIKHKQLFLGGCVF